MAEPLSPIDWVTKVSPVGVPVEIEGYNWRRQVRVKVLRGLGKGRHYFTPAFKLRHTNGAAALNTALGALPFLRSDGGTVDPGPPQIGKPSIARTAKPAAAMPAHDPLDGVLL